MTDMVTPAEGQAGGYAGELALTPLNSASLRDQAYALLKNAIARADLYSGRQPLRLDERDIMQALGISRTPVREALTRLEQDGFVRVVPRRGIFLVRRSKREIIEMIYVWAALESMSARLATLHAADAEIGKLREWFERLRGSPQAESAAECSDADIAFHQMIIRLSGSQLLADATENLFIHARAIRQVAISPSERAARSIEGHGEIIKAFERRDTELAERLTRHHTLDLVTHVERCSDFPD